MILHARHRLDVSLADLLFAAKACVTERKPTGLTHDGALICQSVRSAFDLALTALAWPRGSEVLTTALTIPDMVRVMDDHGLVAVPVDLEAETLAPTVEWLEAARTPRTKAVLVAHLLGGRMDVAPIAAFARRHALTLIEDVAQGFAGPQWQGHAEADVSLFSFGSIKTATALGGALAVVRDEALRNRMAETQAGWPEQPVAHYAKKVARTLALHVVRDGRSYGALALLCERTGHTLEQVLNAVTKGFPDASAMLTGIRRRPAAPLVALLRRRWHRFDYGRFDRRAIAGELLSAAVQLPVVGTKQKARSHWLFAVQAPDPDALIARLYASGFDATRGATSLAAVPAPPGHAAAARVQALLEHIVFLPAWPELPAAERHRLASEVR